MTLMFLTRLMIFLLGAFLVYRLAKRLYQWADVRRKQEQVDLANRIARDAEQFKKTNPSPKKSRKNIKGFLYE